MIVRELLARFGIQVDAKKLKEFDKNLKTTSEKMQGLADSAGRIGGRLTAFVTLPVVGLGAAAVKAASEAEETGSKFATVFQDLQGQAQRTADEFAKNFGQSSTSARQLLGDTGDLLTGFGFTGKAALDLSKDVNELAVDLASFTNFSGGTEGASQALTKALLGERESIKSLGISILETDVQAQVLKNTQEGLTFETERQAKAYATLQLAQKQSKNAIGDFARTNQGFANRVRILSKRVEDLAVSFGKILLPPALKLVNLVTKAIEFFTGLDESTKTLILTIAGIVAVIGPLLLLFAGVLSSVGFLISGFGSLALAVGATNAGLALLALKFIAIAALVAAAFAVVFLVVDDLIAFFQGRDSVTGVIVEKVKSAASKVKDLFMEMGVSIKNAIGDAIDFLSEKFNSMPGIVQKIIGALLTPFRAIIGGARAVGGALGALTEGDFSGALGALAQGANDIFNPETVTGNGVSGLLGFGPSSPKNGGGGNQVNNQVEANIAVSVPEGTPPNEVAPAIQTGIRESLADLFQETGRQVASPIAE